MKNDKKLMTDVGSIHACIRIEVKIVCYSESKIDRKLYSNNNNNNNNDDNH